MFDSGKPNIGTTCHVRDCGWTDYPRGSDDYWADHRHIGAKIVFAESWLTGVGRRFTISTNFSSIYHGGSEREAEYLWNLWRNLIEEDSHG